MVLLVIKETACCRNTFGYRYQVSRGLIILSIEFHIVWLFNLVGLCSIFCCCVYVILSFAFCACFLKFLLLWVDSYFLTDGVSIYYSWLACVWHHPISRQFWSWWWSVVTPLYPGTDCWVSVQVMHSSLLQIISLYYNPFQLSMLSAYFLVFLFSVKLGVRILYTLEWS